jgi:hypothetical protein
MILRCVPGSAGWQPAVSPIGNRRGERSGEQLTLAGYQPAKQPTDRRRYELKTDNNDSHDEPSMHSS